MPRKKSVNRYTLKIYPERMARTAYRVIEIDGSENLDTLCYTILFHFDFTFEHMYEFSLDGRLFTDYTIICVSDEGQPTTDHVIIDQLGLVKGSKFWFHYDFGDDWVFVITVQKVTAADAPEKPKLLRSKGEVEQYPEWDDDDDDWDDEEE